jgi:hypothetical protein
MRIKANGAVSVDIAWNRGQKIAEVDVDPIDPSEVIAEIAGTWGDEVVADWLRGEGYAVEKET